MSNKSRGRLAASRSAAPAEPSADDKEVAERLDDALNTPGKAGLRKLVGMVMDARNKPDPKPGDDAASNDDTPKAPSSGEPLRQPTPYEMAILGGLADKPTYQGTVEPWRVEERRARNRARRRTRQRQRRAARGQKVGAL